MPGPPKGFRYGGRQKGTPNKTTLERAAVIEKDLKARDKRLSIDVARQARDFLMGLAAKYQATDEKLSAKYAEKGGNMALHIAEFETPKLQSTTLMGSGPSGQFVHTLEIEIVPRKLNGSATGRSLPPVIEHES